MVFIEAPAFTRDLWDYLDEEQYHLLQIELAKNPEAGEVMPGTGGFRKLRWADQRRGKGRRGGLRIIYYYFLSDQQIWLVTLYDKDEAADLTPKQKQILRSSIEADLKMRKARQSAPRRTSGRKQ